MNRWLSVLVVGFLVLLPSLAHSQTTLAGVVRDTSGSVLPGVTVEVASAALIERTRAAVSDGSGQVQNHRPGAGHLHRHVFVTGIHPRRARRRGDHRIGCHHDQRGSSRRCAAGDDHGHRRDAGGGRAVDSSRDGHHRRDARHGARHTQLWVSPGRHPGDHDRQHLARRVDRTVHDVLHRQWGARQRRTHADQRHAGGGVVQRRRRLHVHLRRGEHRRDAGAGVGGPG